MVRALIRRIIRRIDDWLLRHRTAYIALVAAWVAMFFWGLEIMYGDEWR